MLTSWICGVGLALAGSVGEGGKPACKCLAKGWEYQQGEHVCINGKKLVCGMNQNISSWIPQDGACETEQRASMLLISH